MDDIGIHLQYRRIEGRGHCAEAMLLEWVEQIAEGRPGQGGSEVASRDCVAMGRNAIRAEVNS